MGVGRVREDQHVGSVSGCRAGSWRKSRWSNETKQKEILIGMKKIAAVLVLSACVNLEMPGDAGCMELDLARTLANWRGTFWMRYSTTRRR